MFEADEFIVKRIFTYFKRRRKSKEKEFEHIVFLKEIQARLTLLARAITGDPIDIFEAEREGGYKNKNFFLPAKFFELETAEENLKFYLFRTLYLSVQYRLGLNFTDHSEHTLEAAQTLSRENSSKILQILFEEFPLTEKIYFDAIAHFSSKKETPDLSYIYGKWMYNSLEDKEPETLQNIHNKVAEAIQNEIKSIKKANAVEEVQSLTIDKKQQEDYVLTHNFEKVETAEEWEGGWRDFDGDDDLDEHNNALEEINMRYTVRVDNPVHSVYQSEFVENTTVAESVEKETAEHHYTYDEWDYKAKAYKKDYCKVYTSHSVEKDLNYYSQTVRENKRVLNDMRKMLLSLNNRFKEQRRQNQGSEFDIDATTDLLIDIYSKHTPTENIYISKRKQEKDLSILMLLDISLSSDSFVANNRILDVEKRVSILFGEILQELQVDFSIGGFYSKTRNYCHYQSIKEFDSNWNTSKLKIGKIHSQGYTRIGPALRHAGALIKDRDAKNKWIILISDGKPNDYDKYEGKYGVQDVKQAIKELNKAHIQAFAIAIEAQPKFYLPQMFGVNHYKTISHEKEMLHALIQLYEKTKFH